MGFDDLLKIFGGNHGGHRGGHHGGHHDDHGNDHHGQGGRYYGQPDQCDGNAPGQGASAPAGGQHPCPKCAGKVQAGFKFCPSCGASVEPAACKGCGAKLPPVAAFCPGCGTKV